MCGICGELTHAGAPVGELALAAMARTLAHRGPDHAATFRSDAGSIGLGFRRLSIIDLRAAAHQPIGNEDGAIQLVFNGEIYNYRELRQPLLARGHSFRSNSDS
jgi:asparagine synthase (glutamine-hydrolysing)